MLKKTFLFLTVLCLFFACSEKQKVDDSKIFRINRYDNITSLDPAFSKTQTNIWLCNQLFNGLVQLDDSLRVRPDVAKSWVVSADGLVYTFILNNNVYYHKSALFGQKGTRNVVASDFVYSFDRLKDKQLAAPSGWVLENVVGYKAVNDTVFELQLKEPYPPFLGLLSMKYCSVVPKEIFKDGGETFTKHPIGTGPFQFKFWEENVKLVLRRNPIYFEKDNQGRALPYLEAVSVTFLPDKQSEFLQMAQGNIDLVSGLDPSYKDEILTPTGQLQAKYEPTIKMLSHAYLNTEYLCFSTDGEKAVDEDLRKAVNYGFDRDKLVKYLRNGIGIAAEGGMIPDGLASYSAKIGYNYNPEKAKELVNKYIKKTGKEPEIILTTVADYANLCEFVQAQVAKVGIKIKVDVVPPATLRQGRSHGKFQFFRASWLADYADGENYMSLFASKNFAPDGSNYSHYKNTQFDKLYHDAFLIVDENKRVKYYKKMDSLMMLSSPIVPLYYDRVTLFLNKKVMGFTANPINLLNLKKVYKK